MPTTNEPPPSAASPAVAAGIGGFAGAVLGVIAATAMMGNGDEDNNRSATQDPAPEAQVAIIDH